MAKILLVEDDEQHRTMLKMALEQARHVVIEAENGKSGIELFEAHQPDIVVTDLVMPEKDGVTMIEELQVRYPEARIVAMSGGPRGDVRRLPAAATAGAIHTIQKPFSIHELRDIVARLLKSPF